MADSKHFLNSDGLIYLWSKIKNYINANKGVGEDVSGQTFTVDETEATALEWAERFNNYENNIATGKYSHAEGTNTIASKNYTHAEGNNTTASGTDAHAEGYKTVASGAHSHAEGWSTTAMGTSSHAEGTKTSASGNDSHAEGGYTIASSARQHVQGKYNIEDANGVYAHIVGNGTSSARANIHTLDWNGVAWFKGGVKVGGTSAADATELTPGGSAEIFIGSTTPSGYTMWIDPNGMITDGNEVGY